MGFHPRLAAFAAVLCAYAFTAQNALALPSYARDSKNSCLSCHYKPSGQFPGGASLRKAPEVSAIFPKDNLKAGVRFFPSASKADSAGSKSIVGLTGFVSSDLITATVGLADSSRLGDRISGEVREDMWYRFAVTPSLMGVNFSFGLFGAGGNLPAGGETPQRMRLGGGLGDIYFPLNFSSTGIDAGFSGTVAGVSLDLQTAYYGGSASQNGPTASMAGQGAFSAAAQLGVGEDYGFSAAYSKYSLSGGKSETPEKSARIGAWFKIKDSIRIMPEYTIYGPDEKWLDKGSGEFYLRFFTGF